MCEVSVIIPNYNHGKYLSERIESVLNQTFEDFEVIILDDCSPDDSRVVIEKYRHHPKVSQIVFNDENSGNTFKQWNKGFELARGQYIWIAESDDYCEPSFLANLVPCLSEDEDIVLSYCQSLYMTDTGEIQGITNAAKMEQVLDGRKFVLDKMMGGNNIPNASMAVFRKSAIEKIPTDYMQMRYCGDWLFWTHLSVNGKVSISGKVLNYYRRHETIVANKAIAEGLDFIEGDKIFEVIRKFSPSAKQIKNAAQQRIALYLQNRKIYEPSVDELVLDSLKKVIPDVKKHLFMFELKESADRFKEGIRRRLKFLRA